MRITVLIIQKNRMQIHHITHDSQKPYDSYPMDHDPYSKPIPKFEKIPF